MGIGTVLSSIMAVLVSLALVLGLAWGALWLLRKWQGKALGIDPDGTNAGPPMRFVRSMPLGQRERVVMINVNGETMLLGISMSAITMLSHWDSDGNLIASGAHMGQAPTPLRTGNAPVSPPTRATSEKPAGGANPFR